MAYCAGSDTRRGVQVDSAAHARLLAAIYDAALDPEGWEPVLREVLERTRANQVVFWMTCPSVGRAGVGFGVEADMDERRRPDSPYWHENPWRPALRRIRPGEAVVLDDWVPPSVLEHTAFYVDYLRPQGVGGCLAGCVDRSDGFASLAIMRSRSHDFGETDRELAKSLLPHLQQAMRIYRELERARLERDAAVGALEQLSSGVLLVDANARVVSENELGAGMLRRADALQLHDGRVVGLRTDDTKRLHAAIAGAAATSRAEGTLAGTALRMARRDGGELEVRVTPLGVDAQRRGGAAALFLRVPEAVPRLDDATLRALYGLTPTESRLAALLAQGRTVAASAERLGMKITTARTHLAALFEKTGARRQPELVGLLTGGLAGLGREVHRIG